ncbi:MAG: S41 family peptidase [Pseudomonadota bacterium]
MIQAPNNIREDNAQKPTKRGWLIAPVIAGSVCFGAILGGGAVAWSASHAELKMDGNREATLHQLDIFADVLARATIDYVVPPKQDKMIEAAINGMLSSLDPHSSFMSSNEYTNMQQSTNGEYGGLGLEVSSEGGAVKVISPMDGSPGERAGMRSGDKIIAIDGVTIIGLPLDQAVEKMRGRPGTTIELTVIRDGEDRKIVRITREIIVLRPVTHRIEGNVGYIRVSTFVNRHTTTELNRAIDDIQRQLGGRLKGVVLDLRNNGGGMLDQAVGVTDVFMDRGEVVSTRGRNPDEVERLYGTAGEKLAGVPLAILINSGTASASEIVAGALQDRGRAVIIGTTTFGKGSVQTIIPLSNGRDGALRLTTARYYTPSGRSIQGAGIDPDIEIAARRVTAADVERQRAEFRGEEDLPNALGNDSGAKRKAPHMPADMPPESWKDTDDYQLQRAIALVNAGLPKTQAAANAVPLPPVTVAAVTTTPKAKAKKAN